jgi:hypothetical protein
MPNENDAQTSPKAKNNAENIPKIPEMKVTVVGCNGMLVAKGIKRSSFNCLKYLSNIEQSTTNEF